MSNFSGNLRKIANPKQSNMLFPLLNPRSGINVNKGRFFVLFQRYNRGQRPLMTFNFRKPRLFVSFCIFGRVGLCSFLFKQRIGKNSILDKIANNSHATTTAISFHPSCQIEVNSPIFSPRRELEEIL